MEKLVEYNLELIWVEGKSHLIADAFPRYPVESGVDTLCECVSKILFVENVDLTKFTNKCVSDAQYLELTTAVQTKKFDDLKKLPVTYSAQEYRS